MCAAISFAEKEVRSKEGMFNYYTQNGDQPNKMWRTKIHMSWVNLCESKFNLRLLRAAYAQMSKIAGKQRADQRVLRQLQAQYDQAQDAIINQDKAAPIGGAVFCASPHGPNNGE